MAARRIPLTVIGGFLGAGKTTLLNRWLEEVPAGRRIAVLVNDFGAVNVDAALVAARAADTIALTNGCVCCSIGGDLSAALLRVLAAPERFDEVVVEASGVSDPWRVAQLGLAAPELSLEGVLVLVDADAVLAQAADPLLADTLRRQVAAADLLVLNKSDLAQAAQIGRVRDWLAIAAAGTPVLETTQAAVPHDVFIGVMPPRHIGAGACGCAHPHDVSALADTHHALFETSVLTPAGVLSAAALRAALREIPSGVLRLKGLVRTDEYGWTELQFAGRHGSLRRAELPAESAVLVAIGLSGKLPVAALEALVAAAAASEGVERL